MLSNDEKRAAYLAAGPRASSTSVDAAVASSLTAAAAFQKAEFFLSRGDVGEAERLADELANWLLQPDFGRVDTL